MNKLYFVKFENRAGGRDTVVFLLTADNDADAEAKGRDLFNPSIVHEYDLKQADVVCMTPDTVHCFEPV